MFILLNPRHKKVPVYLCLLLYEDRQIENLYSLHLHTNQYGERKKNNSVERKNAIAYDIIKFEITTEVYKCDFVWLLSVEKIFQVHSMVLSQRIGLSVNLNYYR